MYWRVRFIFYFGIGRAITMKGAIATYLVPANRFISRI